MQSNFISLRSFPKKTISLAQGKYFLKTYSNRQNNEEKVDPVKNLIQSINSNSTKKENNT